MLVDAGSGVSASLPEVEAAAAAAEVAGYDGFNVPETKHDAFVSLALAARATDRIRLTSSIAVALARNPMNMAVLANDIQLISGGRFRLGLGSQVRPHIERRFAMPWSHPAARMEEFIAAIRAIWQCWATGERLSFRGTFYQHTLMTDFFNPGPNPDGNPPVLLAAVGEQMTKVAGRVADGLLCHSFTTEAYLRERTIPALRAARGSLDGFELSLPVFVVIDGDDGSRAAAETGCARADRLLRLDAGLPAGARPARLGRAARAAQPAVPPAGMGGDGQPDHRRRAERVRCRGRSSAGRCRYAAPLR